MHTQHDTAQVILGWGADFVMTVKGNMPTPYQQLKKVPSAVVPAVSAVTTDHGRRARRTIKAAQAPALMVLDGAAQVAQLRRTVTRSGKRPSRSSTSSPATATPIVLAVGAITTAVLRYAFGYSVFDIRHLREHGP